MKFLKLGIIVLVLLSSLTGCTNLVDDSRTLGDVLVFEQCPEKPIRYFEMQINEVIKLYDTENSIVDNLGVPLGTEQNTLDEETSYYYNMGKYERILKYDGLQLNLMGDDKFNLMEYTITNNNYSSAKGIKIGMQLHDVLKLLPIDSKYFDKQISSLCDENTLLYEIEYQDENNKGISYLSTGYLSYEKGGDGGNRKNILISDSYSILSLSFLNDELVALSGYEQIN